MSPCNGKNIVCFKICISNKLIKNTKQDRFTSFSENAIYLKQFSTGVNIFQYKKKYI